MRKFVAFLSMFSVFISMNALQAEEIQDGWVLTENFDRMDGRNYSYFSIISKDVKDAVDQGTFADFHGPFSITMKCTSEGYQYIMAANRNIVATGGRVTVRYRFDQGDIITEKWAHDRSMPPMIGLPRNYRDFAKGIENSSSVMFQYTDYFGTRTAVFENLEHNRDAMLTLKDFCANQD